MTPPFLLYLLNENLRDLYIQWPPWWMIACFVVVLINLIEALGMIG